MWPFNKKNKETKPLIAARYTYDTFCSLFPNKTHQDWIDSNCPDNITDFVKQLVTKCVSKKTKIERLLIATIDRQYVDWLTENDKTHSQNTLNEYLCYCGTDSDFWNKKLIDSNMTTAYNVLGIPSMTMIYNIDENQSQYSLSKEASNQIADILKTVYDSDYVFVPGWITKGSEMIKYAQDIVQIAKSFWDNGTNVRFAKYLEQNYTKYELFNKFSPLYFVVPFVVKTNLFNANINFNKNNL